MRVGKRLKFLCLNTFFALMVTIYQPGKHVSISLAIIGFGVRDNNLRDQHNHTKAEFNNCCIILFNIFPSS